MRRFVVALLVTIICYSTCFGSVKAESVIPKAEREKIIDVLQDMENEKDFLGMNFDFEEILIGQPIEIYEYSDGVFQNDRYVYPLFKGSELVALAIQEENGRYQIGTFLANAIEEQNIDCAAIVYGRDGCYVYDGNEFVCIQQYGRLNTDRDYLPDEISGEEITALSLCSLEGEELLGYVSSNVARTQTYFSCSVVAVSQGTYKNLCWAACVASIVNTLHGTELRASNVAINKFGASDYDRSLSIIDATTFMNSNYNTSYTNLSGTAPDDIILRNIQAGYPVFAGFAPSTSQIGHAVLIKGINLVSGYVVFMNPESGGVGMCYSDGGVYSYYDESAGSTYYYSAASCQYWTAE